MSLNINAGADAVAIELHKAFEECGLDMAEKDLSTFHKQMTALDVRVVKIINGPESGHYVYKGDILVKFIPAIKVEGVVI